MVATSADRLFKVGETVHLSARVNKPGTKTPVDPAAVTLTTLRRNGVPVHVATTAFTREAEGQYSLVIPTVALEAGTYDLVVTLSDGAEKVVLLTDSFVLHPL